MHLRPVDRFYKARQQAWTAAKVYAAVKDLPEVIPLFMAVGAAVGLAVYTTNRVYFSTAGEVFPDKEMRGNMEKQISYGQESIPRSPMWHIAQWKKDSQGGADIAVWPFTNRHLYQVVTLRGSPRAPRGSQEVTPAVALEPRPSTPPPIKRSKRTKAEQAAEPTQPTKGVGKGKGKAAKAKLAPQPGRCLDRDCNAALNIQRIGESRWRPLEECKRLRDKPPKAQQQQQPAVGQ
ncbi:hypothetical protein QJQ45_027374 [Haematococcus lacustris]|nr:hypothetical protein QJQ45_027374 [Haematococcus lacustris]